MTSSYTRTKLQNMIFRISLAHFSLLFLVVFLLTDTMCFESFRNSAFAAKGPNPAENLYDEAVKFQKAYRFDEAIATLEQVKTKHPYSHFAKMARLLIADIHFEAKNFIQSQYTYQAYLELYPTDEKRDYVLFKIGESLYKQLPSGHDRDLSSAKEAISVFSNMLIEFPNSIFKKDATKYKQEVESKLIQKELYIAKFYFKYKHPLAALKRFKTFIKNNPSSPALPEALAGAAYSAKRINEEEVYAQYMSQLKSSYPNFNIPNLYTRRFVWTSL